jgi:CHASE3 domain sensor protein
VKESVASQTYQKQRDQIDDVVERARALLCGFMDNPEKTTP